MRTLQRRRRRDARAYVSGGRLPVTPDDDLYAVPHGARGVLVLNRFDDGSWVEVGRADRWPFAYGPVRCRTPHPYVLRLRPAPPPPPGW